MKMKYLSFITLMLVAAMFPTTFAQDNTQVGLPEGAIARFGKGGINIMRFSPDGTHMAVGTDVGVWLYNVADGKETALFTGHTGQVNALAFSPDGKKLAATGRSGNPQVWDISTQRDITPPNIKRASTFAFSPDSSTLATVSSEGIQLWKLDIESEEEPILIPANLGGFKNELVFSPDGTILVGAGMDFWSTSIKLWDVATGNSLRMLSGHTESVETLVFSHDGKILASGSHDGTVLLWDWKKISAKRK